MYTKVNLDKKHIVILGGGYCGIRVAKTLARKLEKYNEYQVVLVDKKALHLYAADLYEIATAYYPKITEACLRELSNSITIPYSEVLKNTKSCFLRDTIQSIDPVKKTVTVQNNGAITYEYLVVALGAVTNYYDLPGVQEQAFPLKTIEDALALECYFDQLFLQRKQQSLHNSVHVVIGGGGFTGVEYACELPGFLNKLSLKYGFDPHEVKISIIQGTDELIGLGQAVSCTALERTGKLGIEVIFDAHIESYQEGKLQVKSKDSETKREIPADVLVWTAGIQMNPLLKNFPVLHESGCLDTEPNLEATHYPKVYAGGDNAAVFDIVHHSMLPKLGVLAMQQAPVIAHNIWADIAKKPQKAYKPKFEGFIISLGGKFFLFHGDKRSYTGIWAWLKRRIFDFWYFKSLLPFGKAIRKWWKTEHIFVQND